jgi:serine/threonine-protein kinase
MRSAEVRTQTGVLLGSPKYMSPEQVLGKRATAGSDIFSLGVILYEMLTGKAPFVGADINAIMFQIVNLVPPSPSSVNAEAPAMMDFIVAKMLAKTPDERYAKAQQLADDLRHCGVQIKSQSRLPLEPGAVRRPAYSKIDVNAATHLLTHSYPHSRQSDAVTETIDITTTLGLSKAFDSAQATHRLAVRTGIADDTSPNEKTQELQMAATNVRGDVLSGTFSRQIAPSFGSRKKGWSRRDKLIFLASTGIATVIGAMIVLL